MSSELIPGSPVSDDVIHAVSRLEANLEHQTALREARDRTIAEAWQEHEEAHERLLVRCRALEDEKVRWADAGLGSLDDLACLEAGHRDAMARQADNLSRTFDARSGEIERHHRAIEDRREQDLADERAEHDEEIAERDRRIAERDAELAEARDRESASDERLVRAEERFRVDAFRLSALIALRVKEAEAARAEAAALKQQLALMIASTSWRFSRPLRVAMRLMRRLKRAPGRLVRVVRR